MLLVLTGELKLFVRELDLKAGLESTNPRDVHEFMRDVPSR